MKENDKQADIPVAVSLPLTVYGVMKRLEDRGFEAYAVGGCVRDMLLSRTPHDWDVTTSARPEQILECFADCRTVNIGMKHGTVMVLWEGEPVEITTYRFDGAYSDNRHPNQVTFTDNLREDLARRDFTVNAMAYHPKYGIVDCFHGREDLARRRIACVGNPVTRFEEDGLRILRAVRFASVLDFTIAEETAKAIHSCKKLLCNIAAERIREEFCKLICGKGAVRILREYADVISVFLPEIEPCIGFLQKSKYHCYDVYEHLLHSLQEERTMDLNTRLAVFLHDIGKPLSYTEDEDGTRHFPGHGGRSAQMTEEIMKRLRFDRRTAEEVTLLVSFHDRAFTAEERSVKRLLQKMPEETIMRLTEVKRCDRLAHAEPYRTVVPTAEQIAGQLKKIREADACLSLKKLQIGGDDLLRMGVPRGKEIGKILNALLDRVVEGTLPNNREILLKTAECLYESDKKQGGIEQ